MSEVHLVEDQSSWDRAAEGLLRARVVALDTETNHSHAYNFQICLIQLRTNSGEFIVDPLAVKDLSLLGQALEDGSILKVIHSAENDLLWLNQDFGFTCESLFDTEVSGRLLGAPRSNLGAMVKQYLDVDLPKSRTLQRSDWSERPLTPAQLEYAANDVRYLTSLAVAVKKNLEALGRAEWAQEEFRRVQQVRYEATTPAEDAFLRVKGSQHLDPRQLAVLRELYALREEEAERLDWPPFRVMNNETLIALAQCPSQSGRGARSLQMANARLPQDTSSWFVGEIADAINRGWSGSEFHRQRVVYGAETRTDEQNNRFKALRALFANRAAMLGMDASLLWPSASLERLATEPESWRRELLDDTVPEVRQWQRREFGDDLAGLCASPEWQSGVSKTTPVLD